MWGKGEAALVFTSSRARRAPRALPRVVQQRPRPGEKSGTERGSRVLPALPGLCAGLEQPLMVPDGAARGRASSSSSVHYSTTVMLTVHTRAHALGVCMSGPDEGFL